jgi:hypothetical protein
MRLDFNLANIILDEIMSIKKEVEKTFKVVENNITISCKTIEDIKNHILEERKNK